MIDVRVSSKMSKLGFVAAVLVVMIHADVQEGCPESVRMVKDLVVGGVCGLALTFAGVGVRWSSGFGGGAEMMCRIGVPLALVGAWILCPVRPWPKWLVSCSFPVFALHVFALGFFNVFVVREVNAVGVFFAKCAVALLLPMAFAVFIRRFAPLVAQLLFGGR